MAAFMQFPTRREHVLSNGDTLLGIIPELCLVSHFQVGSWQVLYRPLETGNVKRWGVPLMIPNFSRLKDGLFQEKGTTLPVHGFGRNLPWTTIAEDQSSISIQLASSAATLPNYPYEFLFTVTIQVSEKTFSYRLTIENRGDEVMPIAPGFHPYFAIAQRNKAHLTTDGPPGFDARAVQWDTQPPDNHYPFPHRIAVAFPEKGTLTIAEQPVNGQYELATMQIWSEPATAPDHEFVCFEPIVTWEDGLNRPEDRLNIEPRGQRQIIWQVSARPL